MNKKECLYCNKDISHLNKCAKYCNRDCLNLYKKEQRRLKRTNKKVVCLTCEKEFSIDGHTKFCSDKCKKSQEKIYGIKGNKKKIKTNKIKQCLICKKEFEYKSGKKTCCSDECLKELYRLKREETRKTKIIKKINCLFCGKENEKKKYCDGTCKNRYKNKLRSEETKIKKNLIEKFCLFCGEKLPSNSHFNKEFCDKDCMLQQRYKKTNEEQYEDRKDNVPECKICGRKCDKLHNHIIQTHNMTVKEYCDKFDLCKEDITSKKHHDLMSKLSTGENNYWHNHDGKYSIFSKNNIAYKNLTEDELYKKLKSVNFKNYSKVSQELFWEIKTENCYFAELNHEVFFINGKYTYLFDFVDLNRKKVIEFNGDFWHANPEKYSADEIMKFPKPILAKDVWEKEKGKLEFIKSKGFEVLVIWENEYKNNPELIIEKCKNFLK